ncbi:formin-like protein 3, partial [Hyalella azteca]|uniref:Formin-like protein 3 n=1 Tax=Hyalella azteca TaxID=294128 RepID=A0A8B7NLI6_HYAAZ
MGSMDSKCSGESASAVDSQAERSNGVACRVPSFGVGGGSLNKPKLPMPDRQELEERFAKVLASMDLPPDKSKVLRQYDDAKKWEM